MLFKQDTLNRIAQGEITVAFRRWRRPSVKAGGTLLTPIGQLAICAVTETDPTRISKRDTERAGFTSLEALRAELTKQRPATLYRIEFRLLGEDPRVALRERDQVSAAELTELIRRLARLDQRSSVGPWTWKMLRLIAQFPGVRAGDLATRAKLENAWLKLNVCKLKNLGLTESLNPGYRLSPRGWMLLDEVASEKS
jgi:hypothetical protein